MHIPDGFFDVITVIATYAIFLATEATLLGRLKRLLVLNLFRYYPS